MSRLLCRLFNHRWIVRYAELDPDFPQDRWVTVWYRCRRCRRTAADVAWVIDGHGRAC